MGNADAAGARSYHEGTKHSVQSVRASQHFLDWDITPRPFKVYPDLEPIPLPRDLRSAPRPALAASADPGAATGDGPALDRGVLARLLYFSAGVLRHATYPGGEMFYRAAACTGALYHIDLYLVCGPLADLEAGVYHFGPHDFSLRQLRAGDHRGVVVEAVGGERNVSGAPVTIVLASTYWRNAWKYRRRAYRHVFWDGGTVLAQLLAQAAADGWPAAIVAGFADRPIERLCGLDREREGIAALVPIGGGAVVPARGIEPAPIHFETEPLSPRPVDTPEISAVHARGILDRGDEAAEWRARAPAPRSGPAAGPLVELDSAAAGVEESLEEVIERRGSTRVFARKPIALGELARVLFAASAPLCADYRADPTQSP